LKIRPVELRDVQEIYAIQSACPELAQWAMPDYARVAQGEMAGWVAEEDGTVSGFLVARRIGPDGEILNFAVRPDLRRRGIGEALLHEGLRWAKAFHAERVFLEVRESNQAARAFYEKAGFQATGRRKSYYTDPSEDAIVYKMSLTGAKLPQVSQ